MILLEWYSEFILIRYEAKRRQLELRKQELELTNEQESNRFELEQNEDVCDSCETLKMQLAIANQANKDLLTKIITTPAPSVEEDFKVGDLKPIQPSRHVPFAVRRQQLESEDRATAEALRRNQELIQSAEAQERTADLEKTLRIDPKEEK